MNIFEALRTDHDTQRELADQVIATSGDTPERDDLYQQLKVELKAHAAAEERHFYIPLLEDDATQEKSRHSVAEHHEMDEMMEALDELDYSSPAWLVQAKKLHHRLFHHLREEEHEVFQMAGKVLTATQKTALAKAYATEMATQREKDW